MKNAELIKALRWCGGEDNEWCVDKTYKCPLWNEDRITDECKAELMTTAAYALEAAEKRIADLETALAACRARNGEQLPKEVIREWWLKMRAYITDIAENNKDVPRNKPYHDLAELLLKLMDTIEADSNPASKLVVPKFKQIKGEQE